LKKFIPKENIFGDYQDFIDMEKIKSGLSSFSYKGANGTAFSKQESKEVDVREYRPLEVTVSATLHDIRGHLLKVIVIEL
jgi:hypothetical protein